MGSQAEEAYRVVMVHEFVKNLEGVLYPEDRGTLVGIPYPW